MDKLRSMETFIAVVESGSFTGAATRLEISAVMVGKYIAGTSRDATHKRAHVFWRLCYLAAGRGFFANLARGTH